MAAGRIDDRWLWAGVGIFFFAAVKGIRYALSDVVQLTELDADQYHSYEADQQGEPEDDIPLSTLRTLYHSPNPFISTAAQSLIIKRFAALPSATRLLKQDIGSSDPRRNRLAEQAMQYLCEWDWEIRDSLPLEDLDQARSSFDVARSDVSTTGHIPSSSVNGLGPGGEERGNGENGLVVSRLEELSAELDGHLHGTARFAGWERIPGEVPLRSEQVDSETERRRRRREAMVFHEGEGAIEEADIFRPARR